MSNGRFARGFTLIEVLVALAIVGVALAASVRAVGVSTQSVHLVRERSLAQRAASNFLAEIRLRGLFPETGTRTQACPQGALALRCEQVVQATPNLLFRRVTVRVYLDNSPVLAELDGLVSRARE